MKNSFYMFYILIIFLYNICHLVNVFTYYVSKNWNKLKQKHLISFERPHLKQWYINYFKSILTADRLISFLWVKCDIKLNIAGNQMTSWFNSVKWNTNIHREKLPDEYLNNRWVDQNFVSNDQSDVSQQHLNTPSKRSWEMFLIIKLRHKPTEEVLSLCKCALRGAVCRFVGIVTT